MWRLIVFAKFPRPGRVKTRLVPPLTFGEAATLYTAFLCDSIQGFLRLSDKRIETAVFVADKSDIDAMRLLLTDRGVLVPGSDPAVVAQRGDSLGHRLINAFDDSFRSGYSRVLAVGTDQPLIPESFLLTGFSGLDEAEVAIGPADDGGYYALGLKALYPELFEQIPWSTPGVFKATVEAAERAGLRICRLPRWFDVDDREGLRRLIAERDAGRVGKNVLRALSQLEGKLIDVAERKP